MPGPPSLSAFFFPLVLACAPPHPAAAPDDTAGAPADTSDTFDTSDTSDTDGGFGNAPVFVTIAYSGSVVTVTGTPFGDDDGIRTAACVGHLTYVVGYGDGDDDDDRGEYDHRAGGGDFDLAWGTHTLTGSTRPVVSTYDGDAAASVPDSLSWADGPQFADPTERTLTLDGAARADATVWIAFTDPEGDALVSDDLPVPFPFLDLADTHVPHTFSVQDGDRGGLLLQLDAVTAGD